MKQEEFNQKWGGICVDDMTDSELKQFKADCFELYESEGFSPTFHSPYDDTGTHNGKPFKVIRRATEKECDLEAMPVWVVTFDGENDTYYCYPEEICKKS